ncbi:MAG: discoidin domain-containing protein, partial [Chloroflexi bacterium]|nr:discoidin domain-containing protein [Chloroflexota bacterium]
DCPRFPDGYDPKRLLLGDVDGDGAADLVHVGDTRVTLWINRSGNGWSDPTCIEGTPPVSDVDAVRLVDLCGTGISGLLWSADADGLSRTQLFFLDFTGGVKPYLLNEMDNHIGSITRVHYVPSTECYLADQQRPPTRWQTPLPFPVQVVARVEVIDAISGGRLTTTYRYHHGYWDGAEREFRGFGRVDQRDTETFAEYQAASQQPASLAFGRDSFAALLESEPEHYAPPTETRTWFHQGPIGDEFGNWRETDFSAEFWPEDPPALARPQAMTEFLNGLPRRVKRDALRTLRGRVLRTELYALDGSECQDRPYTVTEQLYGVRQELPASDGLANASPIFFAYALGQRTTQWERGIEPMTQLSFTDDYDLYGQPRSQTSVAVPRGRDFRAAGDAGEPYLATCTASDYARRDDEQIYMVDRVARTTTYEILNDGSASAFALHGQILDGSAARRLIGQSLNFYDGPAFQGLPFGQLGDYGALARTESLVLTPEILHEAYKSGDEVLNPPEEPPYLRPAALPAGVNVALAARNATASASSTFDRDGSPSAVINGDRKGATWPGLWTDNTHQVYPDWIQVDFAGSKTISEIDVFTPQDDPLDGLGPPVDPTETLTFVRHGITDFDVQYWNGAAWVTIPGGEVRGNHNVWRRFPGLAITTDKIRVLVHSSPSGYSRLVEIEAYESGSGRNVALAANGGTASASSIIQPWPPRMAIDGDRIGYHWKGQQPFAYPGWLQVDLKGLQTIDEVDVFFHQDPSGPFVEPTEELTSPYAVNDFEVQYWNGADWVTVPGGVVTGNDRVWRKFRFPAITTSAVRLLIHQAPYDSPAVQEIEVYTATPGWPTAEYPDKFRALLPVSEAADPTRPGMEITLVGYGIPGDATVFAAGYFAATERRRYDFHDDPEGKGRGLVQCTRDPFGRDASVTYDTYDLLPITATDAAGLTTEATYDYRVMQLNLVTDPNGNRTAFTFTPLGLLASTAVMGKVNENVGDTLDAPGVQMVYDFLAFADRVQPISVRTLKRVHHVSETDVPLPERDETIESVEYSDGFGRLLQRRTQAEDVVFGDPAFGDGVLPADQDDQAGTKNDVTGRQRSANDPPRVVVSGWQVYDNKGRVVEKYEPYFSSGWEYQPDAAQGQKATLYYDPRGHTIWTVNPDGSEQRVVHGVPTDLTDPDVFEPTPWEAYTYDANDNAGRTHPGDSASYQHHWDTPASIVVDALGRTIESVERNRNKPSPDDPFPMIEEYHTYSTYDIGGNLLAITDPLGRIAFNHLYDLANRPLRIESIDAGVRRTILDAAGNPVEQRDSKGALLLHAYDVLNRPIRLWMQDQTGEPLTLRQHLIYGDSLDPALAGPANLLGKLYRRYDEAGSLTIPAYDFKGNILEKARQVISDEVILSVFDPPPANWQVPAYRVNWEPLAGIPLDDYANTLLDPTVYQTVLAHDALNRVKTMRYPQAVDGARKLLQPYYNRAGALERVELDGTIYVERIAYNAKGQRLLIAYGNGVMTRYAYDPQTFRLVRLRSERYDIPPDAPLTYHPSAPAAPLQDFGYEYDLVGNITALQDRAPGSGLPAKPDSLDRAFTYDALYRLLSATGRECDVTPPVPWDDTPRCADLTRAQAYTEQYAYDLAGNLTRLRHTADQGSFTRDLALMPKNNRLATVTIGLTIHHYTYDANGNLTDENTSRHFEWDHSDRMRVYRTQAGNAEPSVHTHYLYDASGQRVKKLVRKQGGQYEVTVYVEGVFEYQRIVQGSTVRENNTLHVMDNQSRVALVRAGAPFPDDATPAVKYHLGDHLGSSNLVVGDDGGWINREEYTPYGETSFGSFPRKRYRFTGKERDEESGLYYHGARYYASWLARWASCDPLGFQAGLNLYVYVKGNPLAFIDRTGTSDTPPSTNQTPADTTPASHERYAIDSYRNQGNIPQSKRTGGVNLQGHHPVQNEWAENNIAGYKKGDAPSQFLETKGSPDPAKRGEHSAISRDQNLNRPAKWSDKSTSQAFSEAAKQYEDAGLLTDKKGGLKALNRSYSYFFELNDETRTNPETGKLEVVKNAKLTENFAIAEAKASAKPPSNAGFVSSEMTFTTAGIVLTAYGVYKTYDNMCIAYNQSVEMNSDLPLIEQGMREAGGWTGAVIGGSAFTMGTGATAFLTGLAGSLAGGAVGGLLAAVAIWGAQERTKYQLRLEQEHPHINWHEVFLRTGPKI